VGSSSVVPQWGANDPSQIPGGSPSFLTSSWDSLQNWFTGGNANTTGMSPAMASTAKAGQSLSNIGLITSILGGVGSAVGAYYQAKTAQYQDKSQASSYAFQADMASLNKSREEMTAQSILEAGKAQVGAYTLQAGQQKAGATASMAARGIALGTGTTADISASQDIEKSLNVLAINSNATRQAWAAREQGTNYGNQSLLDRTSSVNALRSAASISPAGSAVNSLLGTATRVAGQWDWNRWMQMRLAQGAPVPQVGIG
jgi:hypothetical protein